MATTTASNCTSFFNLRNNSVQTSRVRSSSLSSHGSPGCSKLDGVAMWLINGVTNAFFASLERCSCINIATYGDGDDVNEMPLISKLRNGSGSRNRTGKGKKKALFVEDYDLFK